MYAIKTEGLTKKYKNLLAVDALDLEIKKGELFALLGVNGAGKTTTIKILSCLIKADAGDAFLLGKSVKSESAAIKRRIGVSPQETAVAPQLSVFENLSLMCGIHGMNKSDSENRIKALGDDLSLNSIFNKKAGKLSGGWQRRLSIAMALVNEPEILFLDEPTLGLDVIARSELWELIKKLKGKLSIILTTHYMEEAESLSDRVGIMKNGRLLTVGTPEELKTKTSTEKFEDAFISVIKNEGCKI